MPFRVATIIEGKGELQAIPILIRRIFAEIHVYDADILTPIRAARDRLLKPSDNELSRKLDLAVAKLEAKPGVLLLVLDSEGTCPVHIVQGLEQRALELRSDFHLYIVVAHRMYETWFLAGASSIAGQQDLPGDIPDHSTPEDVQGAKRWITDRMGGNRAYSPTTDQAGFSATFDMTAARRNCRSFDKFYRTILAIAAEPGPGMRS
jgi:Domain of unknown function (DUF4276)